MSTNSSLAAWPSVLPLPQLDGYKLTRTDLAARRSLTVGPLIARQRSSRQDAAVVESTLVMNALQMTIFEAWWTHTIFGGIAWFTLTLPTDGGIVSPSLVTARCTDGYRAELVNAGFWRVVLPLQIDCTVGGNS